MKYLFLFAGLMELTVAIGSAKADEFSLARENQARYAREVAPYLDLTPYRNALPSITDEQAKELQASAARIVDEDSYLAYCRLEIETYGRSLHCAEIGKNDTPLYGHDSLSNQRIESEAKAAGVSTWFYESPYYKPGSNSQPTNKTAEYQPAYGVQEIGASIQRTLNGGK